MQVCNYHTDNINNNNNDNFNKRSAKFQMRILYTCLCIVHIERR